MVMPDGESAYLVDGDGRVRPYVLDTGSLGDPFPAIGDVAAGTSVLTGSTDGRLLAQAWRENINDGPTTVAVFDTSTGGLQFPPLVVDGAVWSATFTPDAAYLALAIDVEAQLLVVDSATGAERASAPGITVPPLGGETGAEPQVGGVLPSQRPPSVALAGDELLLGAADGSLRVFDAVTFEQRRSIALAADTLVSIRPLDDGTVLTAGRRGRALVDPTTEEVLWQRDQGLSDIGDGASGATCRHLAVFEKRGRFYCANVYGRLAEYDLSSGYSTGVLDAQNGNTGPLWPAGDGTELVSFGDNEAVVTRWRLDGSGPITHLVAPGFRGWRFNPSGNRILVEQGEVFEGRPPRVIDVATGDVVRVLDGLINADWIDDDTVGGALLGSRGEVEGASIDLPDGDLVGNGFIIDPIPNYAGLEPGKERYLFHYGRGTDATLRQLDGSAQRFGPEIFVDDLFSYAISRSGHRVAAGTKGGVEIYDGVTGEQVGAIPGDDLRGVFITVTDQLFVSSLGGELTMYDLDSLQPIRTFGGSRGFITQVLGTANGTIIATNGGDHNVILYDVATGVRIGTPITIPDEESNLIALSLDGRWLSAGGEASDGSHPTKIWDLDPASWTVAACRVAGRNLTRATSGHPTSATSPRTGRHVRSTRPIADHWSDFGLPSPVGWRPRSVFEWSALEADGVDLSRKLSKFVGRPRRFADTGRRPQACSRRDRLFVRARRSTTSLTTSVAAAATSPAMMPNASQPSAPTTRTTASQVRFRFDTWALLSSSRHPTRRRTLCPGERCEIPITVNGATSAGRTTMITHAIEITDLTERYGPATVLDGLSSARRCATTRRRLSR